QEINEGTASTAITAIATFTDPAGAEVVGNYAAIIDWGDGSTDVGTVTNVGGNDFQIDAPPHTFAEEGNFNVQVKVTHESAATLTTLGAVITVDEVQITNLT